MRRAVSFALALIILSSAFSFAVAAADEPSAWARAEVEEAIAEGLVPPELQRNYREPVKRGEIAALIISLLEKASGEKAEKLIPDEAESIAFGDTGDRNVLLCARLGIIKGVREGIFSPDESLTRAQMAAMVSRVASLFGYDASNYPLGFADTKYHWVKSELGWPVRNGIIRGDGGNFLPEAPLTTEQAIIIALRTLKTLRGVTYLRTSERWERDGEVYSVTEWEYDDFGNNTKSTVNGVEITQIAYDVTGHPTRYEYSDGEIYELSYYENGVMETKTVTNQLGTARYYYYKTGNIYKITGTDGAVTSYKYSNSAGRLTRTGETKDAEGKLRRTEKAVFSKEGRLLSETYETPYGYLETASYEYDAAGRLTAWETVYGNIAFVYSMSYNADGSPRTYTRKYRKNGTTRDSVTVRNRWEYDENGNLVKLTQTVTGTNINYVNVRTYEYTEIKTALLPAFWEPAGISALSY